ncbi:MAG: ABC transporter ATP-binding protein [Chthonomonadales bacterium]
MMGLTQLHPGHAAATTQVVIEALRKEYESGIVGLHEVSLTIPPGIFALLGPNGAGKSTLMSILATILEPTSGTARVCGFDVRRQKHQVRSILGYLPQDFGLYPALTTYETLDYMGLLYNLSDPATRRRQVEEVIERVNLTEFRDRRVGELSGGMRQRVGLAQALLNFPKLLIVDEPTAGLDPAERIRIRSLLAELGGDRVIILSTHLIEDVQAVADRVAVLHQGRIRFEGTVPKMLAQVKGRVWELVVEPHELSALRDRYLETGLRREDGRIQIRLVAERMEHPGARPVEPVLEDAYLWLMNGGSGDGA